MANSRIPSSRFYDLKRSSVDWGRWRLSQGMNYAQAAAAQQVSVREWGMLECGTNPENLAQGRYPTTRPGKPRRSIPAS